MVYKILDREYECQRCKAIWWWSKTNAFPIHRCNCGCTDLKLTKVNVEHMGEMPPEKFRKFLQGKC